ETDDFPWIAETRRHDNQKHTAYRRQAGARQMGDAVESLAVIHGPSAFIPPPVVPAPAYRTSIHYRGRRASGAAFARTPPAPQARHPRPAGTSGQSARYARIAG